MFKQYSQILVLTFSLCCMNTIAATASLVAQEAPHDHGDIIIDQSSNQLTIEADLDELIILESSTNPFLPRYLGSEPGFETLESNEPDENFYMLDGASDVYLKLISKDINLQVLSADVNISLGDGDVLTLGGSDVHTHLVFNILPAYSGGVLSDTFQLEDHGASAYISSDPFTMTFVPEPTAIVLMGIGGLMAKRKVKKDAFN